MRILQHDNNTVARGINAAVETTIVLENNRLLGLNIKIRKRENSGGVKINWLEYEDKEISFAINKNTFAEVIYNLMIGSLISNDLIENTILQLNSYTERYSVSPSVRITSSKITSSKPYARYIALNAFKTANETISPDIAKKELSR